MLQSRRSIGFYRQRKHIADAALGLDHARCPRIDLQLASQPQHLDVDAAIENVLVEPGGLQQMLARQESLRGFEKGNQQRVFALAQHDLHTLGIDQLAAAALKLPAVEPVATPLRIAGACNPSQFLAAQYRADARQQFPQAERLDDVVVRAELEADDAIDLVEAMTGQDDDGHVRMGADVPQQVEAVMFAELQVENDQAGMRPGEVSIHLVSIGRNADGDVIFLEIAGHHSAYRLVVVDHDNVTQF